MYCIGGLPSWDTPAPPQQAPQLRPSAPQTHFPLKTSVQSSWQNSKSTAVPSLQNSSASRLTPDSGARDLFTELPPPQPTAGVANHKKSDSLFSGLSAGKPPLQPCPALSHPFITSQTAENVVIQKLGHRHQTDVVSQTNILQLLSVNCVQTNKQLLEYTSP